MEAAVLADPSVTTEMRDAFLDRRGKMMDWLNDIPGFKLNVPQGAFYLFPDISAYFGTSNGEHTITDANDFCEYLLLNAHVAIVTGKAFGSDNCVRFSYASSEETLKEAARRIKEALKGFLS